MTESPRAYDLIIVGVTGYTGMKACQYIAEKYGPPAPEGSSEGVKYGFAARNKSEMQKLLLNLQPIFRAYNDRAGGKGGEGAKGGIVGDKTKNTTVLGKPSNESNENELVHRKTGDSAKTGESAKTGDEVIFNVDTFEYLSDKIDLIRDLTARTKVIVTFVGPFMLHGKELVRACVETGTHYVDSTGELNWVVGMDNLFGAQAVARKVTLIPCCGMDYVPADMCLYALEKSLQADAKPKSVKLLECVQTYELSMGLSRGTMKSFLALLSKISFSQITAMIMGRDCRERNRTMSGRKVEYVRPQKRFNSPFVMSQSIDSYIKWRVAKNQMKSTTESESDAVISDDFVFRSGIASKDLTQAIVKSIRFWMTQFLFVLLFLFPFVGKMLVDKMSMGPEVSDDQFVKIFTSVRIGEEEDISEEHEQTEQTEGASTGADIQRPKVKDMVARAAEAKAKAKSKGDEAKGDEAKGEGDVVSEAKVRTLTWTYHKGEAYKMTAMLMVEAGLSIIDSKQQVYGFAAPSAAIGDAYLARMKGNVDFEVEDAKSLDFAETQLWMI